MTITVGDTLPDGVLRELVNDQGKVRAKVFDVADIVVGKRIVAFGLPGAFTPTCSAKHLPGYIEKSEELLAEVDEIWCLSVNDAFVMDAWGRANNAAGKVRMFADGSAEYTDALGLSLDLNANGMGKRMRRFSMMVDNGVVKILNIEESGKFEISDVDTMLQNL